MKYIAFTSLLFFACGAVENKTMENAEKQETIINSDSTLQTGWYYIVDTANGFKRQLDKDTLFYFINPIPIVTAKNIKAMEIYENQYGVGLSMNLDDEGTIAWRYATQRELYKRIGFIVKNRLLSAPIVNGEITNGTTALNRGVYTKRELEEIQKRIEGSK
jgi:preprotein translocase subunit SecD